ncbi:AbfB domain-containing protein [Acaricomes phytoseiuli]|uniref:AbfB domain-containing protein n=1 Tax=Acaricomes phytoseiuli TaxID=291968 RepID=UPI0012EA666C|nr:AbfB domain-containing protein [Acaricomes phytoseiuli]
MAVPPGAGVLQGVVPSVGEGSGGLSVAQNQFSAPGAGNEVLVRPPGSSDDAKNPERNRLRAIPLTLPSGEKSGIVVALDRYDMPLNVGMRKIIPYDDPQAGGDGKDKAEAFVKRVQRVIDDLWNSPEGKLTPGQNLLSGLSKMRPLDDVGRAASDTATALEDATVVIMRGPSAQSGGEVVDSAYTNSYVKKNSGNGRGSSSYIFMPDESSFVYDFNTDLNKPLIATEKNTLQHELVHAAHIMQGVVPLDHNYAPKRVSVPVVVKNSSGVETSHEVVTVAEEAATVGGKDRLLAVAEFDDQKKLFEYPLIKNSRNIATDAIKDSSPEHRGVFKAIEQARNQTYAITESKLRESQGLIPRSHYENVSGRNREEKQAAYAELANKLGLSVEDIKPQRYSVGSDYVTDEQAKDPRGLRDKYKKHSLGGLVFCKSHVSEYCALNGDPDKDVDVREKDRLKKVQEARKANPEAPVFSGEPIMRADLLEQGNIVRPNVVHIGSSKDPENVFKDGFTAEGKNYGQLTDQWLGLPTEGSGWISTTADAERAKADAVPLSGTKFIPGSTTEGPKFVVSGWAYDIEPTNYFVSLQASADAGGINGLRKIAEITQEWSAIRKISPVNVRGATKWEATYKANRDGWLESTVPEKVIPVESRDNSNYLPGDPGFDPYKDSSSGWDDNTTIFSELDRNPDRGKAELEKFSRQGPFQESGGKLSPVSQKTAQDKSQNIVQAILKDKTFMESTARPKNGQEWSRADADKTVQSAIDKLESTYNLTSGKVNKAFLVDWVLDLHKLGRTLPETHSLEAAARATSILPGVGEAIGMADGIRTGDAESIAVNGISLVALLAALTFPPTTAVAAAVGAVQAGQIAYVAVKYLIYSVTSWNRVPPHGPVSELKDNETPLLSNPKISDPGLFECVQKISEFTWEIDSSLPDDAELVIQLNNPQGFRTKEVVAPAKQGKIKIKRSNDYLRFDAFYRVNRAWDTFISQQVVRVSYDIGRAPRPGHDVCKRSIETAKWPDRPVGWIGSKFPGLIQAGLTENIDASYVALDSWNENSQQYTKVGFTKGDRHLTYDHHASKVMHDGPHAIKDVWPGLEGSVFADGFDAALEFKVGSGDGRLTYLIIKGDRAAVYKYNRQSPDSSEIFEEGFIQTVLPGVGGIFKWGIDAVTLNNLESGKPREDQVILIRGDQYQLYDLVGKKVIGEGALADIWSVIGTIGGSDPVQSAIAIGPGESYIFKDRRYFMVTQTPRQNKYVKDSLISLANNGSAEINSFLQPDPVEAKLRVVDTTEESRKSATFWVRSSQVSGCFRFESRSKPGFYWKNNGVGHRMTVEDDTGSQKFKRESTFCPTDSPEGGSYLSPLGPQGNKDSGKVLWAESSDSIILKEKSELLLDEDRLHRQQSSWRTLSPNWSSGFDLVPESEVNIESKQGGSSWLMSRSSSDDLISTSVGKPETIASNSAYNYTVRPGIQNASCYSFEQSDRPGMFVSVDKDNNENFILSSFQDSQNTGRATFCANPLNQGFSLSPLHEPGKNFAMKDGKLKLVSQGSEAEASTLFHSPTFRQATGITSSPQEQKIPKKKGIPWKGNISWNFTNSYPNDFTFDEIMSVTVEAPLGTRFEKDNTQIIREISTDGGKTWMQDPYQVKCSFVNDYEIACENSPQKLAFTPKTIVRSSVPVVVDTDSHQDGIFLSPGKYSVALKNAKNGDQDLGNVVISASSSISIDEDKEQEPVLKGLVTPEEAVAIPSGSLAIVDWVVANEGFEIRGDYSGKTVFTLPKEKGVKFTPDNYGPQFSYAYDEYKFNNPQNKGVEFDSSMDLKECKTSEEGSVLTCNNPEKKNYGFWGLKGNHVGDHKSKQFIRYWLSVLIDEGFERNSVVEGSGVQDLKNARQANARGGWDQIGDTQIPGKLKISPHSIVDSSPVQVIDSTDPGAWKGFAEWRFTNKGAKEFSYESVEFATVTPPQGTRFEKPQGKMPLTREFSLDGGKLWFPVPGGQQECTFVNDKKLTCPKIDTHVSFPPNTMVKLRVPVESDYHNTVGKNPQWLGKELDPGIFDLTLQGVTSGDKSSDKVVLRGTSRVKYTAIPGLRDRSTRSVAELGRGEVGEVVWGVENVGSQVDGVFGDKVVFQAPGHTRFVQQGEVGIRVKDDQGRARRDVGKIEDWKLRNCAVEDDGRRLVCDNPMGRNSWFGAEGDREGKSAIAESFEYLPKVRVDDDAPLGQVDPGVGEVPVKDAVLEVTGGEVNLGDVVVRGQLPVKVVSRGVSGLVEPWPAVWVPIGGVSRVDWLVANEGFEIRGDYKGKMVFRLPAGQGVSFVEQGRVPFSYAYEEDAPVPESDRFRFDSSMDLNECKTSEEGSVLTCKNPEKKNYGFWGLKGNHVGDHKFKQFSRYQPLVRVDADVKDRPLMVEGSGVQDLKNVRQANARGGWDTLGDAQLPGKINIQFAGSGLGDIVNEPVTSLVPEGGRGFVEWSMTNQGKRLEFDAASELVLRAPEGLKFLDAGDDGVQWWKKYSPTASWGRESGLDRCMVSEGGKKLVCGFRPYANSPWYGSESWRFRALVEADAQADSGDLGSGSVSLVLDGARRDNGVGGREVLGRVELKGGLFARLVDGVIGVADQGTKTMIPPGGVGPVSWVVRNTGPKRVDFNAKSVVFTAPEDSFLWIRTG